jgi:hypothetical protein
MEGEDLRRSIPSASTRGRSSAALRGESQAAMDLMSNPSTSQPTGITFR